MQHIYADVDFFESYSQLRRSLEGMAAAAARLAQSGMQEDRDRPIFLLVEARR